MLSFSFSKRHNILALKSEHGVEIHHTADATFSALLEVQRVVNGNTFTVTQVDSDAFERTLQKNFSENTDRLGDIGQSLDDADDLTALVENLDEPEDLLERDDDAPIIRLINALFSEAIKLNASDIHVESYEQRVRIRFRVDGVMREVMEPNRQLAPLIISRIKVMAKLDIAEKRLPQDGRIALKLGGRSVDLRVSTLPSATGERVVMRLLDKQAGRLELGQLGMPKEILSHVDTLIKKPHGIILVTGPTGSGKTTSLYASLARLNDQKRNIMTVEDPIEYHIDGINQTQVNTKIDMTFARGLRAILRQDPDVVMIGEIRDGETAQIAVQASLTGHLVLSTLHTNTAVGSITRLRDMGVEPFLLSSSLMAVVAQRLVRRLCRDCREVYAPGEYEQSVLGAFNTAELYRPVGCNNCNQTGYNGRVGVYELLPADEKVRRLIHDQATEDAILDHTRKSYPSMREEALRLVTTGATSMDEVLRIVHEMEGH